MALPNRAYIVARHPREFKIARTMKSRPLVKDKNDQTLVADPVFMAVRHRCLRQKSTYCRETNERKTGRHLLRSSNCTWILCPTNPIARTSKGRGASNRAVPRNFTAQKARVPSLRTERQSAWPQHREHVADIAVLRRLACGHERLRRRRWCKDSQRRR